MALLSPIAARRARVLGLYVAVHQAIPFLNRSFATWLVNQKYLSNTDANRYLYHTSAAIGAAHALWLSEVNARELGAIKKRLQ